ncbi:MAG: pilus assembly protein PilP [Nitrospirae bacterium]|nr:pilus assembly protein PilP [Nitrospirota bacterium]
MMEGPGLFAQGGAPTTRASQVKEAGPPASATAASETGPVLAPESVSQTAASYSYDPSGRRDPFRPVGLEGQAPGAERLDLPPLQRVGLTELNVIGIIWGGFGYSAMVQTPDGKGYTVKRGTRVGPNNGVVSAITESAVIVQEQFADVYGKKQVREYVKRLHAKEGSE